jgi:hypothetical protein
MAVAGLAALTPLVVGGGASASPIVSCNQPATYNGLVSAKMRCDAVTYAKVRLVAQCWIFPYIPAGNKYGPWVAIPAGQWRYATFSSGGWCTSPGQIWSVSPQII